ncbi:MAG: SGNH/GDSL hydrolase family protein [Bacteroidetes bacterium]|nr:SGNH/GDSL hydrolase family protein [Bacteroidota bacterium]
MTLPDSTALRVLALGDSYTIGESVSEAERWPVVLAQRLRTDGLNVASPEIVARTGWTTDELDAAIDAANPQGPFDLVTLLIGVNNQYRGRSVDEYRGQFRGLLSRAVGFAGGQAGRVVVVSIPDWGVTPFGAQDRRGPEQIGREVDAFNAVAKEEAAARGVAFVDITGTSRTTARQMVASDGLHPSGAQYALWAEAVRPVALETLRSR